MEVVGAASLLAIGRALLEALSSAMMLNRGRRCILSAAQAGKIS